MSAKKDKLLRKHVRTATGDYFRQYMIALLESRFWERFKFAIIILFRLGYKDLVKTEDKSRR